MPKKTNTWQLGCRVSERKWLIIIFVKRVTKIRSRRSEAPSAARRLYFRKGKRKFWRSGDIVTQIKKEIRKNLLFLYIPRLSGLFDNLSKNINFEACYADIKGVLHNLLRSNFYGETYATRGQKLKVVLTTTQPKTRIQIFDTAQGSTTQGIKLPCNWKTTFFLVASKNFLATLNAPIYQHKQHLKLFADKCRKQIQSSRLPTKTGSTP